MPTYEYQCLECNYKFEAFQPINEKPLKKCPVCKGKAKRMISGGAGLIFKGSGFYITDYKKNEQKKSTEIPKSEEKKKSDETEKGSTS